ncbi:MAG: acyl-CoA thioesterase [Planctomycetes bacterium]|nr:acyl-CoA thioesterase [Planctomycetota bacterium]
MTAQFTHVRRVRFADTDVAGIVHFSNFYRFMEEAEHEYFRSLGLKIMDTRPDGTAVGWPRVRATCTFESPAFYDDLVEVDVNIVRVGVRSLTLAFRFRRGQQQLAHGEVKTVFCTCATGGKFESADIPPEIAAKFVECPPNRA